MGKAGSVDDWTPEELQRLNDPVTVFRSIFPDRPELADVFSGYLASLAPRRRQFSLASLAPPLISNTDGDIIFAFARFVIPRNVYEAFGVEYGQMHLLLDAMCEEVRETTNRKVSKEEMIIQLRMNMMFEIMLRVALTPDRQVTRCNQTDFLNFTSEYVTECRKEGFDPFTDDEKRVKGQSTYRQIGAMIKKYPLSVYMFTSTFRKSCERVMSAPDGEGLGV